MKTNTILLIVLTTLMLFVTACSGGETNTGSTNPYVGGTKGIQVEFVEGMPPTQEGAILDAGKTPFSIGTKLTNVGEHNIAEGDFLELRLKGILAEQFDITPNDMIIQLEDPLPGAKKGSDGSTQQGQFTTLSFDNLRYLPDSRGDLQKTFQVELCYDYSTSTTTAICLAGDTTNAITNPNAQEICKISSLQTTMNSGGPLQIKDFKQIPQGDDKISVTFTISLVDTVGKIFKQGSSNGCDLSITNTDKNIVHLTLSLPDESNAQINCPGISGGFGSIAQGDINLYDGGPRVVTCTIQGNAPADVIYEDLLNIDLDYRFGQTDQMSITIKDLGTSSS
ncbi:hypothetical protein K9M74_02140 [Candidatus Woesearchaeota archaeon]|nr:hypothetical protein [Candidatus Woesearchaeota archaeon]